MLRPYFTYVGFSVKSFYWTGALGYRDVKDYFEWVYQRDMKIVETIEKMVEVAEWGMKIFSLLPQGHEQGHGQGHQIVHKAVHLGLGGVKRLIEHYKKEYHKH